MSPVTQPGQLVKLEEVRGLVNLTAEVAILQVQEEDLFFNPEPNTMTRNLKSKEADLSDVFLNKYNRTFVELLSAYWECIV